MFHKLWPIGYTEARNETQITCLLALTSYSQPQKTVSTLRYPARISRQTRVCFSSNPLVPSHGYTVLRDCMMRAAATATVAAAAAAATYGANYCAWCVDVLI